MNTLDKSRYISVNGGRRGLGEESSYSLRRHAKNAEYQLLFGVQTSEKTQVHDTENRYGRDWYPVGPSQLTNAMDIWGNNILHINYDTTSPDAVPLLAKLIYNNAHLGDTALQDPANGIQLNRLPWHDVDYSEAFERISRTIPVSRIILQASGLQIGTISPKEFVKKLNEYCPYISTILLDDSSGTGKPLDPRQLRPYIEAVYGLNDMPSVAVAGGLNPANVGFKLEGLLANYPNLSIDAETGLRDNYDKANPKTSVFSSKKAREFVSKIIELSSRSTL